MVTIVGIDPGLAATGIGVIKGRGMKVASFLYGSIQTSKSETVPERLMRIYEGIEDVLRCEVPDMMVVEDVFSLDKYPKSGITLGKVSGVILLAGQQAHMPVLEIPAREAKQVLTGNGNAGKQQLEKAVRGLLNHDRAIRPYHASDALGLALVALFRSGRQVGRPAVVSHGRLKAR